MLAVGHPGVLHLNGVVEEPAPFVGEHLLEIAERERAHRHGTGVRKVWNRWRAAAVIFAKPSIVQRSSPLFDTMDGDIR
jgi:hypothetical protein